MQSGSGFLPSQMRDGYWKDQCYTGAWVTGTGLLRTVRCLDAKALESYR